MKKQVEREVKRRDSINSGLIEMEYSISSLRIMIDKYCKNKKMLFDNLNVTHLFNDDNSILNIRSTLKKVCEFNYNN